MQSVARVAVVVVAAAAVGVGVGLTVGSRFAYLRSNAIAAAMRRFT